MQCKGVKPGAAQSRVLKKRTLASFETVQRQKSAVKRRSALEWTGIALGRLRQEDCVFKSPSCVVICLKNYIFMFICLREEMLQELGKVL